MMNGFDAGQHNAPTNSTSANISNGPTSQALHLKRESLNGGPGSFGDDGIVRVNGGGSSGTNSANHTPSQIASVSSVSSSASDRMRSSSSEPQIHSGISSTTPVWTPNVHHPPYDFEVYGSLANGNLGSACCLSSSNGNGPSLSHSHLAAQGANSYPSYYASTTGAPHESASSNAAVSRGPCKPAAAKFWSNSYDSVNGSSPQMPSDHSSIMAAAAVCHPSAFAAAAAHHAAANHIAASAWCTYPTYPNPGSRAGDPYLADTDPRSFVDSATYAHHTAMRMSQAVSEQSCGTSGSTPVTSWPQPTNGAPLTNTNSSTSK